MILQEKDSSPGGGAAARPVVIPSKDLRIFDPTLQRVIIVDDNPTRIVQAGNTRLFKKFHADVLCATDAGGAAMREAQAVAMGLVLAEIEEALGASRAEGIPFAEAYRPYTMTGRLALDLLVAAHGWTWVEAANYLRRHPELLDVRF